LLELEPDEESPLLDSSSDEEAELDEADGGETCGTSIII